MVKETEFYDILEVDPTATPEQIKRAYRKMAIRTHPDKNPGDPEAQQKFQAVSEAYQVLSDPSLRERYDQFGKEEAKPDETMEDPVAFATNIFGGGAFESYIGEISLLKEMTQLGEIDQEEEQEEAKAGGGASGTDVAANRAGKGRAQGHKSLLHHRSKSGSDSPTLGATSSAPSAASEREAKLAAKHRRKERLEKLDKENRQQREERVEQLTKTLIEKLSIYTEAPKTKEFTDNFVAKIETEAANLKMESFGQKLLHTIGSVYYTRASLFLKSQKMLGFGGMFGKIKEAGTMMKDVYDAVSVTVEAQSYISTATELENSVSSEKQVELEHMILGKVLGALWVGSRFEIQGILRLVCDRVLHDKHVPLSKRVERAHALKIMGNVFKSTERTKEEAEEMQFFESLVTEADSKKAKKLRKDFTAGATAAAKAQQARQEADEKQAI